MLQNNWVLCNLNCSHFFCTILQGGTSAGVQTLTFQFVLIELQPACASRQERTYVGSTKIDKMHSKSLFDYFVVIYLSPLMWFCFFFFFLC